MFSSVLGPPLWNTFFADVDTPASSTGGRDAMFADDLNVFQEFDRALPAHVCQEQLERCRKRVHSWNKANRISFDSSKELMITLHPSEPMGEP